MKTALYDPIDIKVDGNCPLANPYMAELKARFSGPNGATLVVPGFFDGRAWVIRFSPTAVGPWTYQIQSAHIEVAEPGGEIVCVENTNHEVHGGVEIWPEYPHHFRFQDGTPYYQFAYEADWLWALDHDDPEIPEIRRLVDTIKEYGFNQLIVNVYAHDTSWCRGTISDKDYGPPPIFAWEGSNEVPDHGRMNPVFFDHYDRMMRYLLERGITVHLFLRVYNKMVNWPQNDSTEDDLFYRYVVARYQAFPNVIWDFSKEAKNEPDKRYIAHRIAYIRSLDGYGRLVTVHDDHVYFESAYRRTMDFLTVQQHEEYHAHALTERGLDPWPIFNSEFGYEHGPGGPEDKTYGTTTSPEEFIHRAYEVATAGAYPAYYYTYTAWDVIDQSYIPAGYRYFQILRDFFTGLEWWRFEPYRAFQRKFGRGMRIPGQEWVIYCTRREASPAHIEVPQGAALQATWMNIYTGEKVNTADGITHREGSRYGLRSPFADDVPWVLHLKV